MLAVIDDAAGAMQSIRIEERALRYANFSVIKYFSARFIMHGDVVVL